METNAMSHLEKPRFQLLVEDQVKSVQLKGAGMWNNFTLSGAQRVDGKALNVRGNLLSPPPLSPVSITIYSTTLGGQIVTQLHTAPDVAVCPPFWPWRLLHVTLLNRIVTEVGNTTVELFGFIQRSRGKGKGEGQCNTRVGEYV